MTDAEEITAVFLDLARLDEVPVLAVDPSAWTKINAEINRDPYKLMHIRPDAPWNQLPQIMDVWEKWLIAEYSDLFDEAAHSGERPRHWRGTEPYVAVRKGDADALLHLLNVAYRSRSEPSWNHEDHYRDKLREVVLNVVMTLNDWNIEDGKATYAIPSGFETTSELEVNALVLLAQKLIQTMQEYSRPSMSKADDDQKPVTVDTSSATAPYLKNTPTLAAHQESLRASLKTLADDFLHASRTYSDRYRCAPELALIHLGGNLGKSSDVLAEQLKGAGIELVTELEHTDLPAWSFVDVRSIQEKYRREDGSNAQRVKARRSLYFLGNHAEWEHFERLSHVGASVLKQLNWDESRWLTSDVSAHRHFPEFWLWALFDVAWQGTQKHGGRMHAKREVYPAHLGYGILPFDEKQMKAFAAFYGEPGDELFAYADSRPDIYYSKLDNVFLQSRDFAEWLLLPARRLGAIEDVSGDGGIEKGYRSRETIRSQSTDSETSNKAQVPKPLSRGVERAYQMSLAAIEACGELASDRKLYDWIKENSGDSSELPEYATWARYVRNGRNHYGTNKNAPRNGREGRSIVRREEIEGSGQFGANENG